MKHRVITSQKVQSDSVREVSYNPLPSFGLIAWEAGAILSAVTISELRAYGHGLDPKVQCTIRLRKSLYNLRIMGYNIQT